MKTFSIYCSGGASRVIRFFSNKKNRLSFIPNGIFYDGQSRDVLIKLKKLFSNKVKFIDYGNLLEDEKNRIHTITSNLLLEFLVENKSEYLFCFGDKILKKNLIERYRNKIINFHPSILPAFKGLNAIDQALNSNVSFLGNTAHFIDEGIDTGKIIIQSAMYRSDFVNYEDVLELQLPMFKIILRDILEYDIGKDFVLSDISERKKDFFIPEKFLLYE